MKTFFIILIVLVVVGIVTPIFTKDLAACTLIGCPCDSDGERDCNSCSRTNDRFNIGIIKWVKKENGKQVISCLDGIETDSRVEFAGATYSSSLTIFGHPIYTISVIE